MSEGLVGKIVQSGQDGGPTSAPSDEPYAINRRPTVDLARTIAYFERANKSPYHYVLTTELDYDDVPVDIFYSETPHKEHGNHYVGVVVRHQEQDVVLINADHIENYNIGMINVDGVLHYSQTRHDYVELEDSEGNHKMIDGGRSYIRSNCSVRIYNVRNGALREVEYDADEPPHL